MLNRREFTEGEIHKYVLGELPLPRRAALEDALAADPVLAQRVLILQRQDSLLRGLGADVLEEPVPERLIASLKKEAKPGKRASDHDERHRVLPESSPPRGRRLQGLGRVPALTLVMLLGIGIGWLANTALTTSDDRQEQLVRELVTAYQFYAIDDAFPLTFAANNTAAFTQWLAHAFGGRPLTPPDLTKSGFRYLGGSVAPGWDRPKGLLSYENAGTATRIAVFVWPGERVESEERLRALWPEPIAARLDHVNGHVNAVNIAVLANRDAPDFDHIAEEIFESFRTPLIGDNPQPTAAVRDGTGR